MSLSSASNTSNITPPPRASNAVSELASDIKIGAEREVPTGVRAIVAPSMLSCDFSQLLTESNRMLEAGADWLHMDDGHFVPNLTIGAPVIRSLRPHTRAFLDCHLMVTKPEQWVDDFKKAGADQYTFHIEATADAKALIKQVRKAGMKVGIAVKPKTAIESVFPFLPEIDTVTVMTVEPGFGGQVFMADMMPKVKALREFSKTVNIQVDGGVDSITILACATAGANVTVSGSGVFKSNDPAATIALMRASMVEHALPLCAPNVESAASSVPGSPALSN